MSDAIGSICVMLINGFILGGTAWLVWHGWSPSWFLFAILVLHHTKKDGVDTEY